MKLNFESRIYPGENPRPKVEIKAFENENLLSASVPWGTSQATEHLENFVSQKFLSPDTEITQVGGQSHSPSLRLKDLIQNANAEILKVYNKDFYSSACETVILHCEGDLLSWAQVGQPSLIVFRDGQSSCLQASHDLAFDFSMNIPLPARLVGISTTIQVNCDTFLTRPGDLLILFNGTRQPNLGPEVKSLDQLFNKLAKAHPRDAFWLAMAEVS